MTPIRPEILAPALIKCPWSNGPMDITTHRYYRSSDRVVVYATVDVGITVIWFDSRERFASQIGNEFADWFDDASGQIGEVDPQGDNLTEIIFVSDGVSLESLVAGEDDDLPAEGATLYDVMFLGLLAPRRQSLLLRQDVLGPIAHDEDEEGCDFMEHVDAFVDEVSGFARDVAAALSIPAIICA